MVRGEVVFWRDGPTNAIETERLNSRGLVVVETFEPCESDKLALRITQAKRVDVDRFEFTVWEEARDEMVSPTRFDVHCTSEGCRVLSKRSGGDYRQDCP